MNDEYNGNPTDGTAGGDAGKERDAGARGTARTTAVDAAATPAARVMATFQIDVDVKRRLKAYCVRRGVKMGFYVEQALRRSLDWDELIEANALPGDGHDGGESAGGDGRDGAAEPRP